MNTELPAQVVSEGRLLPRRCVRPYCTGTYRLGVDGVLRCHLCGRTLRDAQRGH